MSRTGRADEQPSSGSSSLWKALLQVWELRTSLTVQGPKPVAACPGAFPYSPSLPCLPQPCSRIPWGGSGPHGRVWPWQCVQRECEEAEAASTAAPAQDQQKAGKSKNGTHSEFNWNTHFSGTQLELESSKAFPFAPALWNKPLRPRGSSAHSVQVPE